MSLGKYTREERNIARDMRELNVKIRYFNKRKEQVSDPEKIKFFDLKINTYSSKLKELTELINHKYSPRDCA